MKNSNKNQGKRIREGDNIVVIAGNEKGKHGTVLRRFGNDKVLIRGLNIRKKHIRPSEANPKGGTIEREMPIHISNVMVAPTGDKGVKLRVQKNANGDKELVYLLEGNAQVYRPIKQAK